MALTVSNLTTAASTTNGSVFTTASITPTPGALVLVAATAVDLAGPVVPTVVGNGITYSLVATVIFPVPATIRVLVLYVGRSAAPSAGPVVLTGTGTYTAMAWAILEVTGGVAHVRQQATTHVSGPLAAAVALPAPPRSGAVLVGIVGGAEGTAGNYTPGTDFTELAEAGVTANDTRIMTEWWATPTDTTVDATWTTTGPKALVGLEIAPGLPSGGGGGGAGRGLSLALIGG